MMIWTSFLKSFGNRGRSGLSVSRSIRIASVLGLPSRRKKLPGILPLAYSRSSKSIVSGKKSMPSLGCAIVAVTRSRQSPYRIVSEPLACSASFPVSMLRVLEPIVHS